MGDDAVQRVRRAFTFGEYRVTEHAETEREADVISSEELLEAFGSERLEQLESYPYDARGASGLFLGFTRRGLPVHAVIGLSNAEVVIVITMYRPDPELWYDWRRRVSQ